MKKIFLFQSTVWLIILAATLNACKKSFLEITPKGKLIAEATSDYDLLLNNLDLVNMVSSTAAGASQIPMGDEVSAIEPYFGGSKLHTQRLFGWKDVIYEPDEDAVEMAAPMKSIYTYNKIINEVMESEGGTEQQKKAIQAEALAGRAWTYFLLINYYGKPYSGATAATDPGFPILKENEITQTRFVRASVQEVYDFIVSDLKAAIPNLTETHHRLRMSKTTAEGLLGKVYMFMQNFNEALPYLNNALAALPASSIPVNLYNYNTALAPGGAFFPIGIFGPKSPALIANEEVLYAKQFNNNWNFINNEIVASTQTVALFHPSDLRLKFYSKNAFFGGPYPNGMLRRMGPISTQFGFTVPDLYLLIAECKARLNDLNAAATILVNFRENRMPVVNAAVPDSAVANQNALVKYIIEERIREFAVQGYRWFDMRRLSVDPQYSTTVGTVHAVYSGTGTIEETHQLRPERLVLRFSQKLMDQNPGMPNNP